MVSFVVVYLRMDEKLFDRFSISPTENTTLLLIRNLINEYPKVADAIQNQGKLPRENWNISHVTPVDSDGLVTITSYLELEIKPGQRSETLMHVWRVCQTLSLLDETIECIAKTYYNERLHRVSMATHFMGACLESYKMDITDLLFNIEKFESFMPRSEYCSDDDYMDDVYPDKNHWYLDCVLSGGSDYNSTIDFNTVTTAIRTVFDEAENVSITIPIKGDELFDTEAKRNKFRALVDHQTLNSLLKRYGLDVNHDPRVILKPKFEFSKHTLEIKGKTFYPSVFKGK